MNNRRYIIPSTIKDQYVNSQNQYQENQIPPQKEIVYPWANKNLQEPSQNIFPQYFSSVTRVFPADSNTANACKIPFGIIISPASVSECPIIDCTKNIIIPHCEKCKSYLCPQVQISRYGNSWICPICGHENKIPHEYFGGVYYQAGLLQNKQQFNSRIELQHPVYDIIVPKSNKNINSGPAFCFLADMSFPALSIGFTQQMLLSIKASLDSLNPNTHVALIAMSYDLRIFDLVNSIEIVVPDISEIECKLNQTNLFPQLKNCKDQLINAIDELLKRPINANIQGHCFGSALQLCEQIMDNTGGIILAGLVGLPKYGPYQLKERKIIDNDEFPLLQLPKDGSGNIFKECAFQLNRKSISVHLFSAGKQYTDLSTIGVPAGLTTGECKHYSIFDEHERIKMHSDIFHTLTNQYYWDSYIKLHMTSECKVAHLYSNCIIRKGGLISFPIILQEDAITIELRPTEQGIKSQNIVLQLEFVYTNNEGCRMIRIFSFEMPVSNDISKICSSVDEAALATMMCKRACNFILSKGTVQAVELMKNEIQSMINQHAFNFCSIYHLMHALLSNAVLRSIHPYGVDGRMSQIVLLRNLNITDTLLYLYPRMFSVDTNSILPLALTSFGQGTMFLFHTHDKIYIWVSAAVDQSLIENAFGCQNLENLPTTFPPVETKPCQNSIDYLKLQNMIFDCVKLSKKYLNVEVIGQENPRENIFSEIIVDDSTVSGSNLLLWIQNMQFFSQMM